MHILLNALQEASERRHVASTALNRASSRSHLCVRIVIESKLKATTNDEDHKADDLQVYYILVRDFEK